MQAKRHLPPLVLAFIFAVLSVPAVAQQVIATVPVGRGPDTEAINPSTNMIYVANVCGNDFSVPCNFPYSQGTVSVINGSTNAVSATIAVGYLPYGVAVNPLTNQIYVANQCGNDPTCASTGTLSVIDGGSNSVIATVIVGSDPYAVTVNTITNRIYVVNGCGTDPTCTTYAGSVSVIDGASDTVLATVPVGASPENPVINQTTNQIYVPNSCGTDSTCAYPYAGPGTVTVIDGATNNPSTVQVGVYPWDLDVNPVTNKIYVANQCGDNLECNGLGSVTVIDGSNLSTTEVGAGGYNPFAVAVNSTTNKIFVLGDCFGDPSCGGLPSGVVAVVDGSSLSISNVAVGVNPLFMGVNSVTNKVYVANYCGRGSCSKHYNGTVTVIDAANPSLPAANVNVGTHPYDVAINSATNKIYIPNICGDDTSCVTRHGTVSVIDGTPPTALQFVSLPQPCRAVDTRPSHGGGGPIQGGTFQSFSIAGSPTCPIPSSAAAYSMNVTVVPQGSLGYLTVWPTGKPQPLASTLNSLDGRVKAVAAIMPGGTGGQVSVYATNTTDVILDVAGYFVPPNPGTTLEFYPLAPCRVADTRNPNFPMDLGPPSLTGGHERVFPILNASATCNIPTTAQAYSLNLTVVPQGSLGYLTVWPTGQPQPTVSTLNDVLGQVIANAAIVVGDSSGQISAYATSNTDLIIDINGYFGPASPTGLSLYGVSPCRVIDTRKIGSGSPFTGTLSPPVDVWGVGCAASSLAQAYVFNASVIPMASLGYLTLWPDGQTQPTVSTLNSVDGSITSNMAIVPTTNGSVNAFVTDLTQLFLDLSSYFAP